MKYFKFVKAFTYIGLAILLLNACKKTEPGNTNPMGDAGQTLVKIIGGGTPSVVVKKPIDFLPVPITFTLIDLRRDLANSTDLAKTMTITVKDDIAAVAAENPAYLRMPASWYSITTSTSTVQPATVGGNYVFTMNSGEFAKYVNITIPDATVLDPSSLYAFGFTITTADADGVISTQKSVIVEIGAKNAYDGIYAVTGPMADAVNSALIQWHGEANPTSFSNAHGGAWGLHLITTGANSCVGYEDDLYGNYYHPIYTGTGTSTYGAFGLNVFFNPATGAVSQIRNRWGETDLGGTGAPLYQSSNTRWAALDPSGANAVQGNRDILVKYFMYQPSAIVGVRTTFDEKWEYIGSR